MKRQSSHQREPRPATGTGSADSDAEEFARAMKGVTRIARDHRHIPSRPHPIPPPVPSRPTTAASRAAARSNSSDLVESNEELEGFVAAGVDRRELRRLKRGDHTPGDRLDLHGLTGAEAAQATTAFLEASRYRFRCVALVHGRGLHSAARVSVLKTRVRALLREHPAVLAFADAPRTAGGPGAVYILLRK